MKTKSELQKAVLNAKVWNEKNPDMRPMKWLSVLPNGYTIETWYDRCSQNWITQFKDEKGNQAHHDFGYVDSDYSGCAEHAKKNHFSYLQ